MSKNIFNNVQFYACVDSTHKLDFAQAEIAFVGRSNVGKSSLINAICNQRLLAKVSKTPGKTRTINVYSIKPGKWLVDLPGYGFAAVSHKEKNSWKQMIDYYFSDRTSLKAIFILIDAHVGPTTLDLQMLDWLESVDMPYQVIVNKIDRLTQAVLTQKRQRLPIDLEVMPDNIIWVSAKKEIGINELRCVISNFLNL